MRFQQKNKSLMQVAKESLKTIPLNNFMGQERRIVLSEYKRK